MSEQSERSCEELSNCGWCQFPGGIQGNGRYVNCKNTKCFLYWVDVSVEDWNRRALPEQVRVLVAALEDIKTHSVPPFNTVRWCAYSNFVATEALKDFKGIPAFPEEKPDHVA